jgi:hypothetical protein
MRVTKYTSCRVNSAIDGQNRSRLEVKRSRHLQFAMLAVGHHRERRQVAVVVQQQV